MCRVSILLRGDQMRMCIRRAAYPRQCLYIFASMAGRVVPLSLPACMLSPFHFPLPPHHFLLQVLSFSSPLPFYREFSGRRQGKKKKWGTGPARLAIRGLTFSLSINIPRLAVFSSPLAFILTSLREE